MEDAIKRELEHAGFEFVQAQPRLGELRNLRPDLIGWAADAYGELVPWAVVESKRRLDKPELALAELARYRELLHTVEHYLVLDGQWFRAGDGLRSIEPVDAPLAPRYGGGGELRDLSLATSLIAERLWRSADRARTHGRSALDAAPQIIRDTAQQGIQIAPGAFARVAPKTMFQAVRRVVMSATERGQYRESFSLTPVLAAAMAALVGNKLSGTVLDPFAGVGTLLWSVADRAVDEQADVNLRGNETNSLVLDVAAAIGSASPLPVSFEAHDEYFGLVELADAIVTVPPFGFSFQPSGAHYELLNGHRARDGDVANVDKILRRLAPGGRAVILVPSGFTFRASGEEYRRFLASRFRVAALLGLEGALQPHTSVSTVLMVIDHAEPGETFVAQLAGDWQSQLSPGGAALGAALDHIDGRTARI
ncbi:N-6 DNA methylase [Agromyces neolithicus]|uniref:DNA methylase adenine-specific domain-containing protein n=1 Tax=Agromyces neolithicus TaxID=269420 RepID=A0ABN2MDP5_9MICO